ncbi:dUTP diphosphatase [Bacillus spongiae]|uniref:dUTP diphosphatase n=1 Tax=Bacillus spongiae TaxID=2683610 RepID=A0ABU8HJ47_9BACI
MQNDLLKLVETQRELRKRIGYNESDRHEKLVLAFLVELGELANETRCFKFWSKKPPSEKKKILEEYSDGFHFVLELGIEIEYDFSEPITISDVPNTTIEQHFLKLSQQICSMRYWSKGGNAFFYKHLLDDYIKLGMLLGFSWEEIVQAYYKKNEINHTRQESGY